MLYEAGLRTIPGTAAEILDDEVRKEICPLKMPVNQWVDIMKEAHKVGFKTTSTIIRITSYNVCYTKLLR